MKNIHSKNSDSRLKDYDISDFDENMNLKFGSINSLIVIYLLSPIAISFICSHAKGGAGLEVLKASFLTKEIMYFSLLGTLPIIVFLAVFLIRQKNNVIQKIKANGKALILFTSIYNCFVWSYIFIQTGNKSNLFHVMSIVVSFFTMLYVLKSKRLSDYFVTKTTASSNQY